MQNNAFFCKIFACSKMLPVNKRGGGRTPGPPPCIRHWWWMVTVGIAISDEMTCAERRREYEKDWLERGWQNEWKVNAACLAHRFLSYTINGSQAVHLAPACALRHQHLSQQSMDQETEFRCFQESYFHSRIFSTEIQQFFDESITIFLFIKRHISRSNHRCITKQCTCYLRKYITSYVRQNLKKNPELNTTLKCANIMRTSHSTAGVGKQVSSTSLYHVRHCGIILLMENAAFCGYLAV